MTGSLSKAWSFVKKWESEAVIFLFLMLSAYSYASPTGLAGWQTIFYTADYSLGFCSRLFIGSIMNLIFPNFIPAAAVSLIVFVFTALVCLFAAVLLGRVLKIASRRGQLYPIALMVLIYLAMPTRISCYFMAGEYFGKMEIFLFPLMLLAVILLLCRKLDTKLFAALAAICLLGCTIYQAFIFLCFPIVLALLIYNFFESGFNKRVFWGSFAVCAVAAAAFLYFQLLGKITSADAQAVAEALQSKTDLKIIDDAVFYEYFSSFSQFFSDLQSGRFEKLLWMMIPDILLLSPVIFAFLYIWIKALISADKRTRLMLILTQVCSAAFLPIYVITCDWGRWNVCFIMFQFILLFSLWYKQCKPITDALYSLAALSRRHMPLTILVLIYLFSLDLHTVANFLSQSHSLYLRFGA